MDAGQNQLRTCCGELLSFFCVYFYFSTLCFYSVKTSLMYDADFVAQSRDAAYSAHTGQVGLQAVRQHWHG